MWSLARVQTGESSLITACKQGDSEALRHLFTHHKDRVYRVALACLGDTSAAEDITQEVFVTLPERLRGFRSEATLSTFLYRVTVNLCRDELRRRQRAGRPIPTSEPPDALAGVLERRELHTALASLPEELRAPLLLRYFEELSYDEVAETLSLAPGTVASRLHRGLKRLAHLLGERDE